MVYMNKLRLWITVFLLAMALMYSVAWSASVFVYVNKDGDKLITDHRRAGLKGYTLVKSYDVDDDFGPADRAATTRSINPVASKYDDLIFSKADKFGIEPALMKAIVHIESSFNPDALSPAGALGLMQLMPGTAQRYGVTSRTDPDQSLDGGGRYMRDLLLQFNHDIELALAAYNAGENAVEKYQGIPPYAETQAYVVNVMSLVDKYRQNLWGV